MRYLFIVQGEGRGHMTQAISLGEILRSDGHEIVHVIVGKSPQRIVPRFFHDKMGADITELESPNFVSDKKHKSVKPLKTVIYSLSRIAVYRKSIRKIKDIVADTQPDVIVNFYDFLGGIYNFLHGRKTAFICLAHQYLLGHPDFDFPPGRFLDRASLKIANRITSLKADKVLALSFQPFDVMEKGSMRVVPPLLRDEVKKIKATAGDHILAYMVNPGYGEEVESFHKKRPDVPIECFWDQRDKPEEWQVDDTLTFHQLNDKKFLEKMASCKGYISTAGFESICEAMYLGKPVMMIPVKGHYEQACNAVDGQKAGAGIPYHAFDISVLVDYIPKYKNVADWFCDWANRNKAMFLKEMSEPWH